MDTVHQNSAEALSPPNKDILSFPWTLSPRTLSKYEFINKDDFGRNQGKKKGRCIHRLSYNSKRYIDKGYLTIESIPNLFSTFFFLFLFLDYPNEP